MENVLDYLEKTAKKYPTQIAVEDETTSLMWAELVYRAKRIGSVLCDQMKRQDAVVIVAEKSTQTLAHMFGVLYAGGFYVMVDPMQPQDRIQRIFSVLRPSLVIADEKYMENVKQILSTMQKKETEDRPRLTAMQTLLPSYDVTDKVTEDSGTAENTADQPWNDLVAEVKLQKIRPIFYTVFSLPAPPACQKELQSVMVLSLILFHILHRPFPSQKRIVWEIRLPLTLMCRSRISTPV